MTKFEILASVCFLIFIIVTFRAMVKNYLTTYRNEIPDISAARRVALLIYFGCTIVGAPILFVLIVYVMVIKLL